MCWLPIYQAYKYADYWTTGVISFVSVASIFSHLIENHKHGMPGYGFSSWTSRLYNKLDVFGSMLTIFRMMQLYYIKYGLDLFPLWYKKYLIAALFGSFLCLRLSERDHSSATRDKYMILHIIWHVTIYPIMYLYLKDVIYLSEISI